MGIVNWDTGVCALTDIGMVRTGNEDSNRCVRTPEGDLFVVCDGMGGHAGGAVASQLAADSICEYFLSGAGGEAPGRLRAALDYANGKIYSYAASHPALKGMGTTACVAWVQEDRVWYAHIGDSRIYFYCRQTAALYRLTKDHSVVQGLVDQGLLTEEEAEHHPKKNRISRSLGIKAQAEPELCASPAIPAEGDIMLICSDGLSGMVTEAAICETLFRSGDLQAAGQRLIHLAKAGGGTDNITVQLIRFSGTAAKASVFEQKHAGVSCRGGGEPARKKRRIWPVAIPCLAVAGLLAAGWMTGFAGGGKRPLPVSIEEETVPAAPEDAYVRAVGQYPVVDDQIKKGGADYILYGTVAGRVVTGVMVNELTKEYRVGQFHHNGEHEYGEMEVTVYDRHGNKK